MLSYSQYDKWKTSPPENDWTVCDRCGHTVHVDEAIRTGSRNHKGIYEHPECLAMADNELDEEDSRDE